MNCTVSEAKGRVTLREFIQWQAFWSVEPWEPEREDWRAAQICHTLYSMFKTKGMPRKDIKDFMLGHQLQRKRQRAQTPEEIMALMKQFASAQNQIHARKGK